MCHPVTQGLNTKPAAARAEVFAPQLTGKSTMAHQASGGSCEVHGHLLSLA